MPSPCIAIDDPQRIDVRDLIERHHQFALLHSPPLDAHTLDVAELIGAEVTVFSARVDGELVAIGAIRELDEAHAELKSMHTLEAARGRGIGEELALRLIEEGRSRGYLRLSLETGSMDAFGPARALYAKVGFEPCGPFGDYPDKPGSSFMTMLLDPP